MDLIERPYRLYLPLLVIFVVLAAFDTRRTLDIHLHDTYFIIAYPHFYIACGSILAVLWLLSMAFRKIFWSRLLTWHQAGSTLVFISAILIFCWTHELSAHNYFPLKSWQRASGIQTLLTASFAASLLLLVHIFGGLIKWATGVSNKN